MRKKLLLVGACVGVVVLLVGLMLSKRFAYRAAFDRIESGMTAEDIERFLGPREWRRLRQEFPHWVDTTTIYDVPGSAYCWSWTNGSDTIVVVFDEEGKAVKKEYYGGRSGIRDHRQTWLDRIRSILGL
jgi:hypothetical protein